MNRKILPAIVLPVALVVAGVVVFAIPPDISCGPGTSDPDCDDHIEKTHDYVWSGPIAVTKYEHKLGEDVFMLIRGLGPNEKGAIGVFTPEGILYKSFQYDGSKKSDFNQYFYPDTTAELDICKPEQLVGIWKIVFADNSYPSLEFKMKNELLEGMERSMTVVC